MSLTAQKILGVDITISSYDDILEEVQKYFTTKNKEQRTKNKKTEKPFVIFTPNPEIINYAQIDNNFKEIVNTAQINLPDGAGIVWAIKKLFGLKIEKIAGIDFMLRLIDLAQKESLTIGLIGGRGELADRTAECLQAQYQPLKIEAFEAPELEISKIKNQKSKMLIKYQKDFPEKYFQNLAEKIIDKKIDMLFVALGFPKQEYFIENIKYQISLRQNSGQANIENDKPLILMAVGGAFDYISGRVPRAPLVVRNLGLEWLFRLIREPWRLPRQIIGVEFFIKILLAR